MNNDDIVNDVLSAGLGCMGGLAIVIVSTLAGACVITLLGA